MKNPYEKLYEAVSKALAKLSNMIVWLAKQTLSVKEFTEFMNEFGEKKDDDEIIGL